MQPHIFHRTRRHAFLNPFFSFSCRERKERFQPAKKRKRAQCQPLSQNFLRKSQPSAVRFIHPYHPKGLCALRIAFRSHHRTLPTFHTPRNPRARPLAARGGSGEPFGRFPRAFFLLPGVFFLAPQKENAVCIPFSEKRKKRMGAQTHTPRNPRRLPEPNCDPAERLRIGKEEGASEYGAFGVSRKCSAARFL